MKNVIRIAAAILSLSGLGLLCSCGESGTEPVPAALSEPSVTAGIEEVSAETEELSEYQRLLAKVPQKDLGGGVFRFLNFTDCTWANTIMSAEEENGEVLNDAVWQRNDAVASALNVTLEEEIIPSGNICQTMRRLIQAGDDAYDVFWGFTQDCASLISNSLLYDAKELKNLDLAAPWYNQKLNEQLNFGDKYFMLFGDAHIGYYQAIYMFGFNKTLLGNYDLEDPYTLYENGKWTWDKMYEMASAVQRDLNGDGVYNILDDCYGLGIAADMGVSFLHSAGFSITGKDQDNYPVYDGIGEKLVSAYQKACQYLYCSKDFVAVSYLYCNSNDDWDHAFQEDRCLFVMDAIGAFADHRASDVVYGMLSVPKYDENQTEYITPMYYNSMAMYIPITNDDLDTTGIVLENLYAQSHETVRNAFIDSIVYHKFARDESSIAMIDTCIDHASVDIAYVFNWGAVHTKISDLFKKGSMDLMSAVQKVEPKLTTDLDKTMEAYHG